ncbi:hypothetical protein [Variovorax sp. PCZ-1]|uniref:AbrB/MazE/SpoVT family DNA-binding domain-containing protein n=1 Tax=Variovorax sp. PCZ-1 TaxID=2835533 RepID=UPI001BD141F0|nr:hypothetical protein [Variovorax sp. PCZ-1]MBS7806140.1 hypothetical protein [Variovorax sp. PCZ-1]
MSPDGPIKLKVTAWGNGAGVRLTKAAMRLMDIDMGTELTVKHHKEGLLLIPDKKRLTLNEKLAKYDKHALMVNTALLDDGLVGTEKFN